MDAETAIQKAIRARLLASPELLALVPAAHILDVNERPAPRPSIILGESQSVDEGADIQRRRLHVWHSLHLWVTEPSTAQVKAIAGAIREALKGRLDLGADWHCASSFVASARFLRDPDGQSSHGVLTVELQLQGGEA